MGAPKHSCTQQLPLRNTALEENTDGSNLNPNMVQNRLQVRYKGQATVGTRETSRRAVHHATIKSIIDTTSSVKTEMEESFGTKQGKVEHRNSHATRRGPMDEMRQLIRILAKLMPGSEVYLKCAGDDHGGNRVSEEQIRSYLKQSLGEAPQPEWGLPDGWGQYIANLFNWALGDCSVSADAARGCAKRNKGVYPDKWPLPLTLMGVRLAQSRCKASVAPSEPLDTTPGALSRTMKRASMPEGQIATQFHPKRLKLEPARSSAPGNLDNPAVSEDPNLLLDSMLMHAQMLLKIPEALRGEPSKQFQVMSAISQALPEPARRFAASHEVNVTRHEELLTRMETLVDNLESVRAPAVNPKTPSSGKHSAPELFVTTTHAVTQGRSASLDLAPSGEAENGVCTVPSKGSTLHQNAPAIEAKCKVHNTAPPIDTEGPSQDVVNDMTDSQYQFLQSLNSQEPQSQEMLIPWSQPELIFQSPSLNSQSILDGKFNVGGSQFATQGLQTCTGAQGDANTQCQEMK